MPKKTRKKPKTTIAQAKRRSRKRRAPRRNPSMTSAAATKMAIGVGSAFAGYAATRLLSRIIATQVSKRWPKAAKHAGVLGSAASFGAAFLILPHWKRTEEYSDEALLGSGVAVIQNVARTYLPKYGWIVGDYQPEIEKQAAAPLPEPRGDAEEIDEDLSEGWQTPIRPGVNGTDDGLAALPGTGGGGLSDDDLSDILDTDLGSLGGSGVDYSTAGF